MTKIICGLALASAFCLAALAEPSEITIQALNGKDGKPLVHQRLLIFGGKTAEAARFHETNFEAMTDENGFVTMPLNLANTHWIEVFADELTLCHSKPNLIPFSVDAILSTGLAAPNECGNVAQRLKPGNFTVFARPSSLREKMAR
jgi:hypothetical protein